MRFSLLLNRLDKLGQALRHRRLLRALIRHRVLGGAEHRDVLSRDLRTVVDIGANRGQFALAARVWSPDAKVVSFEPLGAPANIFRRVFSGDDRVILHQAAIGPLSAKQHMHVSARDDSSSLYPISQKQTAMFPGTGEIATAEVSVAPLDAFLNDADLHGPAMLKLDVQGFEYEALTGCESLLRRFDWIYCECSYVEFYSGQKLAGEVVDWLAERGFRLAGLHNSAHDPSGRAVQADFLFCREGRVLP
jgi:FkbM family methyltransferase